MPVTSPEAKLRKRLRQAAKRRLSRRCGKVFTPRDSDFPATKIMKRRLMPKLPPMSKSQLRAMLSKIVANT